MGARPDARRSHLLVGTYAALVEGNSKIHGRSSSGPAVLADDRADHHSEPFLAPLGPPCFFFGWPCFFLGKCAHIIRTNLVIIALQPGHLFLDDPGAGC